MPKMEVYDPPMCCSSGICGPSVDPALARFAADLEWLKGQGVEVTRFNLAQEAPRFAGNKLVADALRERGTECLPLVLVDGRVVAEGVRPSRDALAALAGIVVRRTPKMLVPKGGGSCCSPGTGCC